MAQRKQAPSYPAEWHTRQIQAEVRALARHKCEQCGIEFRPGTNVAVSATASDGKPLLGAVHHIDYDTTTNTYRNLVYLCQNCHAQVTGLGWKPGDVIPLQWKDNIPAWITARQLPYQEHPQLRLFEEE